jgi:hypothetical protein
MWREENLWNVSVLQRTPKYVLAMLRYCFKLTARYASFQILSSSSYTIHRNIRHYVNEEIQRTEFCSVLTIVYSNLDSWVFGLCPSSGIKEQSVSGTGPVPVLMCGPGAPTVCGPLDTASLSHHRVSAPGPASALTWTLLCFWLPYTPILHTQLCFQTIYFLRRHTARSCLHIVITTVILPNIAVYK